MPIKPFPEIKGIHAFALPISDPPDLMTVNLYAVGKDPVTLVDAGFRGAASMMSLKERFSRAGLSIGDIGRILFTHGHPDHVGMAASIRKEAGHPVECFIHAEDQWQLVRGGMREVLRSEEAEMLLAGAGIPEEETERIKAHFLSYEEFHDPVEDVSLMEDGDAFLGDGYCLRVRHTPGHTAGSCCIYEEVQEILFSGDHILKEITPNPLIELNRSSLRDPGYQSLNAYMRSLEKLKRLHVRFVFPGHGEYLENMKGVIDSYKVHHRQRMDLIWNQLKESPRTVYDMIPSVFPHMPENDTFLAMSEIITHLEILINEGRAMLVESGPPALYLAL